MPRAPEQSPHALAIRAATFVAFQTKLRARAATGDLIPLHLGDSHLPPPEVARRVDMDDPRLHLYGPVTGDPALREAGAADLARLGLETSAERVFPTPGATGGLDVVTNAVLAPGDEVLVLTPSWPLAFGILQRRGCVPVEVPISGDGALPGPDALAAAVKGALSERTAGLYLSDPNNPVGYVLTDAHLAALRAIALEERLWVFYDAVYADLAWAGARPRPLEALSGDLAGQAFCLTSFSKTLGLAGHRVGLAAVPPAVAPLMGRLLTHSTYHTANVGQRMAWTVLDAEGAAEAERTRRREAAAAGAALVRERLTWAPAPPAGAGAFAFVDLRERAPSAEAALELLERFLDEAGVSLAPGATFGRDYARFARLCFTSTPLDALEEGLDRLARLLG